jgi:putative hydrolase of the HAD superfamily
VNSTRYKGIFFDAGNTLLRVYPSIGVIYSEAAKQFGADVEPERIEKSFKELWNKTAPLVNNEGHRLSYEKERDWWKYLVREVFRDLIEIQDFDKFFDHLYYRFEHSDTWRLYDDVIDVLQYLKINKFKLAVVSNWDSRLPSLFEHLGLGHFFDAVIISSIVGYEKPHPAIFKIALEQTALQPEDVLYVGDDPFLDYQAAKKAGLNSLHLDRNGRFADHADKISDLHQLVERIQPPRRQES